MGGETFEMKVDFKQECMENGLDLEGWKVYFFTSNNKQFTNDWAKRDAYAFSWGPSNQELSKYQKTMDKLKGLNCCPNNYYFITFNTIYSNKNIRFLFKEIIDIIFNEWRRKKRNY
jgi:hypothetical protein